MKKIYDFFYMIINYKQYRKIKKQKIKEYIY